MTKLIRGLHNVQDQDRGAVLTIGNFDGVHKGHQQLLSLLKQRAVAHNAPSMVMIFEPQPIEYYLPAGKTVPRLLCLRDKYLALKRCGIDRIMLAYFNNQFAQLSPVDFVQQVLVEALAVKHIMVGADFRFGHKRSGDIGQLQALAAMWGFGVEVVPELLADQERVSSTLVRQALAQGRHDLVSQYLGHHYTISGRVVRGAGLGRQLGVPTANIKLYGKMVPIRGVYAVMVHGIDGKQLLGVANVGVRPTVAGTETSLEVHIFDFAQDIYNRYLSIVFCHRLRDEQAFADLDLLRQQMMLDIAAARAYFATST